MKILTYTSPDFESGINKICDRSAFTENVDCAVSEILKEIRENGDKAVVSYAKKYDHVELTPKEFLVRKQEIDRASKLLDSKTKSAIHYALENILSFSKQRNPKTWNFSPRPGVVVGEKFEPFDRIAAYIPGGHFPLASTVIHTAGLAKAAGVKNIAITTPVGSDKVVHPAILYSAKISGATEIYRLGGVYGIGALAFGTETIKKVEKIVGPGNSYVTAAKRKVYGVVALDLVAGPSEVLIIADDSANPRFIAADMLAQAEHGSGFEHACLITNSPNILEAVNDELGTQKGNLENSKSLRNVLEKGTYLIEVKDLRQAVELANRFAPEHLEIMTEEPEAISSQITAAGAIFSGSWSPEPIGDYLAGPSHVLPTGGSARFFSGLSVDQFFRRISTVQYERMALKREAEIVNCFSKMEGLEAHGRSVRARFN